MVTGELKRRIDALWTEFWQGGITNPLTVIEQITFLMYARLLDINEKRDEKREKDDEARGRGGFLQIFFPAMPCGRRIRRRTRIANVTARDRDGRRAPTKTSTNA